jgi:hypothetical protein
MLLCSTLNLQHANLVMTYMNAANDSLAATPFLNITIESLAAATTRLGICDDLSYRRGDLHIPIEAQIQKRAEMCSRNALCDPISVLYWAYKTDVTDDRTCLLDSRPRPGSITALVSFCRLVFRVSRLHFAIRCCCLGAPVCAAQDS